MDVKVKMIKSFCEGNIAFDDLTEEVKTVLKEGEIVNDNGELTDLGLTYKEAVIAKPIPGTGSSWPIRP